MHWSSNQADDEVFHAIPLRGAGKDHPLLGILLVGNSRRAYVELKRRIRASALLAGGGGIVLAILLSSWAAARVTRPVEQLARGGTRRGRGQLGIRRWRSQVSDEIAQLAESFNRMTAELLSAKRTAGAGRARGGVAGTGAAAGARVEESAVPIAAHGGESGAGAEAESGTVRRSLSREFANPAGGDFESEDHHRPLQ